MPSAIFTRACALLLLLALFGACKLPKDPEGTLDAVRGQELRIGLLIRSEDLPAEERAALATIAESLGAEAVEIQAAAHDLVDAVARGEVHLVAGRLPRDTPFGKHLGLTKPWGRIVIGSEPVDAVFGIRKGENAFLKAINIALAGESS